MNPIHVTIQKTIAGQEIPDTRFKILDHQLSGRTLKLTIKESDLKIQALWDEVNQKLYLVGDRCETSHVVGKIPRGILFAFTTELPSIKVSIDLSPLWKKRTLKVFEMDPADGGLELEEGFHFLDRQEKLLMSIDTRSKQVIPTYKNKTTAAIHQIPLQKLEPGQDIAMMDFEVLSYAIIQSTLKLFIADYIVDDSAPPYIQAFWDQTNKKFYLAGGRCDFLQGQPKRREIWLDIDISSLGLEGKLDVYKLSDEVLDFNVSEKREELLMSVTIPPNNPQDWHSQ